MSVSLTSANRFVCVCVCVWVHNIYVFLPFRCSDSSPLPPSRSLHLYIYLLLASRAPSPFSRAITPAQHADSMILVTRALLLLSPLSSPPFFFLSRRNSLRRPSPHTTLRRTLVAVESYIVSCRNGVAGGQGTSARVCRIRTCRL